MTTAIVIPSGTSVEKLRATVRTDSDPTGGTVQWQLTAQGTAPSGASWQNGAWSGSYANGTATAVSPLVISALGATSGSTYDVWVRFGVGQEQPERLAGTLSVR